MRVITPRSAARFFRPLVLAAFAAATTLSPVGAAAPAAASHPAPASVSHPATAPAHPAAKPAARPSTNARPASIVPADLLPASTCSLVAGTRSCDLYAMTGTLTLPDATSVPIWGYASSAAGPAGLPGPTIIANQGETLQITLHNVNLPDATSLQVSELNGVLPDTVGVTAGNSTTYTYTAAMLTPGTYLYEAGLTADGPRQAAMGLFGAIVVRPSSCGAATNCAYDANSAFDDEALLVLSEVDPAFNAAPLTFDMSAMAPKYWLINGLGFPNTTPINTAPGHNVLLRYINAGLLPHSMAVLGRHQVIVGVDGKAQANPQRLVAETVPQGSTLDSIVSVSATAPAGARYAVFDGAMRLDNAGALTSPAVTSPVAYGGMLTFIAVAGSSTAAPGPVTSGISLSPNPTNGSSPESLGATETASGGATVQAAEYFINSVGAGGSGTAMTGTFGGTTANVSATLSTALLATLSSDNHTIFVHGQDSNGTWGVVASAILTLDTTGPGIDGMVLSPSVTNGTADVGIQATANDTATGNQDVVAAEYFVDPVGTPADGTGTPLSLSATAPASSLTGTIPAATVAALSEGSHTVAIRAEDALGNWGAFGTITLTVDKTGPGASGASTQPTPTNGTFGIQVGSLVGYFQLINATISDPASGGANSNVAAAEFFIDTIGANGSGSILIATDGAFNSPTEAVYQSLPLYAIAALTQGQHTIFIHGQDAAGNWGPFTTTTLVVDKTGPTTSGAFTPNPSGGAATETLNATATDPAVTGTPANAPASNVVQAEWWTGADPGQGLGHQFTITTPATSVPLSLSVDVRNYPLGSYTFSMRAMDAAHNWGPVSTASFTVNIRYNPIFADGFESGNTSAWSAVGGTAARRAVTATARQAGSFGFADTIAAGTSGYVQDNSPTVESTYHARFYFNPNNVTVGTGGTTIFTGLTGTGGSVFTVQLRKVGSVYSVRAVVNRSGGTTATNWFTIAATAFTAIEINWASAASASFGFSTGGVLQQTLTGLNTNALKLETVRLGFQGTLAGASGTSFFDSFVSTRNTVIGL